MVGIETLTAMAGHLLGRGRKIGAERNGAEEGSDAPATQRAGQPAEVDMASRDEQHRRVHAGRTHVPMIFIPARRPTLLPSGETAARESHVTAVAGGPTAPAPGRPGTA